jgi:hypothetical protein
MAAFDGPLHTPPEWSRREPLADQVDLSGGIYLDLQFDDATGVLESAYADLREFLAAVGIAVRRGGYPLVIRRVATDLAEAHSMETSASRCVIAAGDTEGIRRGLVFFEDEMLRCGGPLLTLGVTRRKPLIRTRIGHRFIGTQDSRRHPGLYELTDGPACYPEPYLNRLVHEGINALWFRAYFGDLVQTRAILELGPDTGAALENLRTTATHCLRYGVRLFVLCIEPASLEEDSPVLEAHPELAGHRTGGRVCLCTSSQVGQAYLEEATRMLFEAVPGLGGIISLCVGERPTHCYSGSLEEEINCPRCSQRSAVDVLAQTLAAMERGMHSVAPQAELIAWPYSQYLCWGAELTRQAAGAVPPGTILQHNFESSGQMEQLGRMRKIDDYSLVFSGTSELFGQCAAAATERGTPVSAKLQVSQAFELSTMPYVPVPGRLYETYGDFRQLGVSCAMQGWYSGNYPSVMTRAAAELSFEPFPTSADDLLQRLARRDWQSDAQTVAAAWRLFGEAFDSFPLSRLFNYYGPMNNGIGWPLYLEPRDSNLTPNWLVNDHLSGDRIGECVGYTHTPEEAITLSRILAETWQQGVELLLPLRDRYRHHPERLRDIGIAEACGLQFCSGMNILRFYHLREALFNKPPGEGLAQLEQMQSLVNDEIRNSTRMGELIDADPRLGFDVDASGYKFYPALIQWRLEQLSDLLEYEFPGVAASIKRKQPLFVDYSGEPGCQALPAYHCRRLEAAPGPDGFPPESWWAQIPAADCGVRQGTEPDAAGLPGIPGETATSWQACYDDQALWFRFQCNEPAATAPGEGAGTGCPTSDTIHLHLEPRRTWPPLHFACSADGERVGRRFLYTDTYMPDTDGDTRWTHCLQERAGSWILQYRLPAQCLGPRDPQQRNLRINVLRVASLSTGVLKDCWATPRQEPSRLMLAPAHLVGYGWLVFDT